MRLRGLAESPAPHIAMLFSDELGYLLSNMLRDESEYNREQSVAMLLACTQSFPRDAWKSNWVEISRAVCTRFKAESLESCEEIRLQLMVLLGAIIAYCPAEAPSAHTVEILECVSAGVGDSCADVKRAACAVVCSIRSEMARDSTVCEKLIDSLVYALKHQHWRVRKSCIEALGGILSLAPRGQAPLIADTIDRVIVPVAAAAFDRAFQVREALVTAIRDWLQAVHVNPSEDIPPTWTSRLFYVLSSMTFDESQVVVETAVMALSSVAESPQWIDMIHQTRKDMQIPALPKVGESIKSALLAVNGSSDLFRVTSLHGKHCIKTAVGTCMQPSTLTTDTARTMAVCNLVAFAVHVSGTQIESVLSVLCNLAGDNLYPELVRAIPALLSVALPVDDMIPLIGKFVSAAVKSSVPGNAIGPLRVLRQLVDVEDATREEEAMALAEAVIKCLEPASYWPVLAEPAIQVTVALLSKVTVSHGRERLFRIMLRCKANGSDPSVLTLFTEAVQLMGTSVLDDVYVTELVQLSNSNVEKDSCKRAMLIDLVSMASVEHSIKPSLVSVLLPVISRLAVRDDDDSIEARLDGLELVHILTERGAITGIAKHLLVALLLPNCQWRPGQANTKLRKVALVCFRGIFAAVPTEVATMDVFTACAPVIKSCMDDSWSPDNRILACSAMNDIMSHLDCANAAAADTDPVVDTYPDILKRLDDSQNEIRIIAAKLMGSFFDLVRKEAALRLPVGTFAYIVKALLIHLDDSSEAVASAVQTAIERGRTLFPDDIVGREAAAVVAAGHTSHTARFKQLVGDRSHFM